MNPRCKAYKQLTFHILIYNTSFILNFLLYYKDSKMKERYNELVYISNRIQAPRKSIETVLKIVITHVPIIKQ